MKKGRLPGKILALLLTMQVCIMQILRQAPIINTTFINTYTLTFEVECVFLPTASWCKPYKQTDTLLRHEQLHFDIQEIFARKLMVAFKAKTYTANYTNEIKAIFDSVANKESDMQDQYDQSTNFSEIKGEQLKWENLVHQQLQETAAIGKLF